MGRKGHRRSKRAYGGAGRLLCLLEEAPRENMLPGLNLRGVLGLMNVTGGAGGRAAELVLVEAGAEGGGAFSCPRRADLGNRKEK
jgi:hypothetical protein